MRHRTIIATAATLLLGSLGTAAHAESTPTDAVNILFVGNSFTHGRYRPALNYNAGPGDTVGNGLVHDLLCPSLPCPGVEGVAPVTPTAATTPGSTVAAQLSYLQARPAAQYTEVGPFGGAPGIFLQFTKEAGLHYTVSLIAVSSATLKGYSNNTGNEAGDLPLIESAAFNQVVLQDQSFEPLPTSITVNGRSVPTRGNPVSFQQGITALVNGIDAADKKAGVPNATVTLAQTPPLASYGYTSANPALPIFGSNTAAQQNGNPAYAPYIGDAHPIAAMAADLHAAYETAAATFNAGYPASSQLTVSLDGDAWVTAIDLGFAEQDPYPAMQPYFQFDLWDSNPLLACCTVPIGYHPSVYGDYVNALVLYGHLTGLNPVLLTTEYVPLERGYASSASSALGISPLNALKLAVAAEETLVAGGPVTQRPAFACLQPRWAECRLPGGRGHDAWPF